MAWNSGILYSFFDSNWWVFEIFVKTRQCESKILHKNQEFFRIPSIFSACHCVKFARNSISASQKDSTNDRYSILKLLLTLLFWNYHFVNYAALGIFCDFFSWISARTFQRVFLEAFFVKFEIFPATTFFAILLSVDNQICLCDAFFCPYLSL